MYMYVYIHTYVRTYIIQWGMCMYIIQVSFVANRLLQGLPPALTERSMELATGFGELYTYIYIYIYIYI